MHITQLRNASIIVDIGAARILVDPMLAPAATFAPFGLTNGRYQRNPMVELPAATDAALDGVTHCLITHCQKGHFDHLDRAGKRWLRERRIPVICTPRDGDYLARRGLAVTPLPQAHAAPSPFLGGTIRTVACTHGTGVVGRLMEHGVGYLIEMPGAPRLYLAGDTVLTPALADFLAHSQPDVCVLPAGGARFDVGGEIIMGVDDVLACLRLVRGQVLANHLEALSHCPVRRADLAAAARAAGLHARLHIPADGETVSFSAPDLI